MPRMSNIKRKQFNQIIDMPRGQKLCDVKLCGNLLQINGYNNGTCKKIKNLIATQKYCSEEVGEVVNKAKMSLRSHKIPNYATTDILNTGKVTTNFALSSQYLHAIPLGVTHLTSSTDVLPPGTIKKKIIDDTYAAAFLMNLNVMCCISNYLDKPEFKSESSPETIRFVFYVLPPKYPLTIFLPNNAVEMKKLLDEAQSGFVTPRIQFEVLESGAMKVVCMDERTVEWFIKEVATWVYVPSDSIDEYPLRIVPDHLMPKLIHLSCVVRCQMDGDKFLRSVNYHGTANSSKWKVARVEEISEGTKVFFGVDPKSYRDIYLSGYLIDVRDENVSINVEVNPFAV